MSEIDTGGPAFPRPFSSDDVDPDVSYPAHTGMALRDYFAAKAMEAHIGRNDVWEALSQEKVTPEKICYGCYAWADIMLKARKEQMK